MKFKALIEVLRRYTTAIASVFALGVRASGALLTIAIFTVAGHAMAADEFGRLAVWFNAVSLLAVAAVFGQDTLIMRSWGEYSGRGEFGLARSAYRFGWRVTILSGLGFAVALLVVSRFVDARLSTLALFACPAFLFTQTMLHYSSNSSRAIVGLVVSEINRELTWRLVMLGALIWAVFRQDLSLGQFFVGGVIGMILSLTVQSVAVRRKWKLDNPPAAADVDARGWMAKALSMWISAIIEAISQYADVMLVAYFASPADAGNYFVAARIANIFLMVMTGLHTYSLMHSASLFFSNQRAKLQKLLRTLAMVSLAFVLPAVVGIVLAGSPILSLFGARYASAYPILIVLTLASFARSLCGPAPGILLTTGHERLYSWIVTVATATRLVLTAALAYRYGALGAAVGWAIGNVPLSIGLALICRMVNGIDPTVLAIFLKVAGERALRSVGSQT